MTGFCALAIKSTLIPPITTFKREERGKKWLEGLEGKVPKSSLLSLVTFPTLLKAIYLIYSVKDCAYFAWLDTGMYHPNQKEWKSLPYVAF